METQRFSGYGLDQHEIGTLKLTKKKKKHLYESASNVLILPLIWGAKTLKYVSKIAQISHFTSTLAPGSVRRFKL